MVDKKVLKLHFSRNAVNYNMYAMVQKDMTDVLLKEICPENNCDEKINILDIGCGTGYMTSRLLEIYPNANITAVDIAPGMIECAKKTIINENVEFVCTDIEEARFERKYNLIVSNATFQWFNHLGMTISKIGRMLKEGGTLAVSTFGDRTFFELYESYEIAKKNLNLNMDIRPGQKFFSRDEFLGICKSGLGGDSDNKYEFHCSQTNEVEYFDTVRNFLKSVKKIGANNSNKGARLGPAVTREMMRVYNDRFVDGGRIKATYHCIFFVARKSDAILYY